MKRRKISSTQKKYRRFMNRKVEVRTKAGTYWGKVVKVGRKRLYLQLDTNSKKRRPQARVSFAPILLPLVLYNILVVVLLNRPCPIPYGHYPRY